MKYYFLNINELTEDDSSLILGWFKINDVEIVKETKCIILIALSDLAYGLIKMKNKSNAKYAWTPCDSGECITFERKKSTLKVLYKNNEINLQFEVFYNELLEMIKNISEEMYTLRNAVKNEVAFVDLIKILNSKEYIL